MGSWPGWGFVAIIAALVLEQWRPLSQRRAFAGALASWAHWIEQSFNAGERRQGTIAWLVAVLPPLAIVALLHGVLFRLHPVLARAARALARGGGHGAQPRGGDPPRDRGGAARHAPPRVRRAPLVHPASRPDRRRALPARRVLRGPLAEPRRLRRLRPARLRAAGMARGAPHRGRLC